MATWRLRMINSIVVSYFVLELQLEILDSPKQPWKGAGKKIRPVKNTTQTQGKLS